ncbi:MAG: LysE family transporter [Promethearchaeota archaeon]|jgi:threonine/homoserine/homoserine lactone efflux protein
MIEIFLISFSVGLSGALMPGPVLTFTISNSLKEKKGYLAGFYIVGGHLALELVLLIFLLLGTLLLFQNTIFLIILGIVGGSCLIIFGLIAMRDIYNKQYEAAFNLENQNEKSIKGHSFFGGIFYSITNPYWILWWVTAGLDIMYELNVSLREPLGFILFFFGHELADFVWYVPISIFIYQGGKALNQKLYKYVLIICAGFMISIGIYLILKVIVVPPQV